MLEIKPIPKVKMQFNIAVAILIAAKVSVECLHATTTSPTPIKMKPKFPMIIGAAIVKSSLM